MRELGSRRRSSPCPSGREQGQVWAAGASERGSEEEGLGETRDKEWQTGAGQGARRGKWLRQNAESGREKGLEDRKLRCQGEGHSRAVSEQLPRAVIGEGVDAAQALCHRRGSLAWPGEGKRQGGEALDPSEIPPRLGPGP